MLVPNAALRWRPKAEWMVPDVRAEYERADEGSAGRDDGRNARTGPCVWVQEGDLVRPIYVQTGLTDDVVTEITGGDLKDKTEVIVGQSR
jgi:hypothetical protein